MELILVRHAEAESRETKDGSPADPGLTPRGRAQAEAVARWLAREEIDHVVSSPSQRARQTASPTARLLSLEPAVDPRLAEIDPGATRYRSVESERARGRAAYRERVAAYRDDPRLVSLSKRVDEALGDWAARHAGGRVVVFCHGGVINVFACRVLGLAPDLLLEAAHVSSHRFLVSRSGIRSVRSLNETAYLAWELADSLPAAGSFEPR